MPTAECYLIMTFWYKKCFICPIRDKCPEKKQVIENGEARDEVSF